MFATDRDGWTMRRSQQMFHLSSDPERLLYSGLLFEWLIDFSAAGCISSAGILIGFGDGNIGQLLLSLDFLNLK